MSVDLPAPGEAPAAPARTRRKRAWAKRGTAKNTMPGGTGLAGPRKKRLKPKRARSVTMASVLWDAVASLADHFDVSETAVLQRMIEDGIRAYDTEDLNLAEKCRLGKFKHNPFIKIPDPPAPYDQPVFHGEHAGRYQAPEPAYYEPLPPANIAMLPQGGPPIPRGEA